MKGKVSIFPSGKMISVGTRSESQAHKELKLAARFLVERGFARPIRLTFKTQNMVISVNFRKSLSLERLSETAKAIYEPDQFSGAIIRYEKPHRTSILVFASGKAVITGLKNSTQIKPTIEKLRQLIESNQ
jgi:TATA-box binding protein (TBP) (component of TFIID and TFIIIB)